MLKPEDPQVDIETSEVDGSNTSTKPLSQNAVETQGTPLLQAPAPVCKRPSTPSTSELRESLVSGETSFDVTEPSLKKSKNSETPLDSEEKKSVCSQGQAAANLENSGIQPATDKSMEDVANLPSESKESADADKDETQADGKHEQSTINVKRQEEYQSDRNDIVEESLNKVNEELLPNDPLHVRTEQEIQQPATESGSECEEGEVLADIGDHGGGGSLPNEMASHEPGELQPEHPTGSDNQTRVNEEPLDVTAAAEVDPSQGLDDDKNEVSNITHDIGESSEKLNDNNEQPAAETDEVFEAQQQSI